MTDRFVAAVIERFERQELAVRRLYAEDQEFRTVCEDYATARQALALWEERAAAVEEYRRFVRELEEEITDFLAGRAFAGGVRHKER